MQLVSSSNIKGFEWEFYSHDSLINYQPAALQVPVQPLLSSRIPARTPTRDAQRGLNFNTQPCNIPHLSAYPNSLSLLVISTQSDNNAA